MLETTMLIGLNDKDTKTQLVSTEHAKTIVNEVVGDCSILTQDGYYTHDDGTKVHEVSFRVTMWGGNTRDRLSQKNRLKAILNQESIGHKFTEIPDDDMDFS